MVIHHHHFRLHGGLARLHHEARIVLAALGTEAVLAGGYRHRPCARAFRHVRQFGFVAAAPAVETAIGKAADDLDMPGLVPIQETAVGDGIVKVMQADIVGAAFQQGGAHRNFQRFSNRRNIAVIELVLQCLGAGGNDHLAAGTQRRHQIREGLSGAGARLGNQHAATVDGGADFFRHFDLTLAVAKGLDPPGQGACRAEQLSQFRHARIIPCDEVRSRLARADLPAFLQRNFKYSEPRRPPRTRRKATTRLHFLRGLRGLRGSSLVLQCDGGAHRHQARPKTPRVGVELISAEELLTPTLPVNGNFYLPPFVLRYRSTPKLRL